MVETTAVLTTRVPMALAEAVRDLAKAGGRSVEAEIRRALREYVAAQAED